MRSRFDCSAPTSPRDWKWQWLKGVADMNGKRRDGVLLPVGKTTKDSCPSKGCFPTLGILLRELWHDRSDIVQLDALPSLRERPMPPLRSGGSCSCCYYCLFYYGGYTSWCSYAIMTCRCEWQYGRREHYPGSARNRRRGDGLTRVSPTPSFEKA